MSDPETLKSFTDLINEGRDLPPNPERSLYVPWKYKVYEGCAKNSPPDQNWLLDIDEVFWQGESREPGTPNRTEAINMVCDKLGQWLIG